MLEEDPSWGPSIDRAPPEGHPLTIAPLPAVAASGEVHYAGGRIDALLLCGGRVSRTAEPDDIRYGFAQVRRRFMSGPVGCTHLLFAPERVRPLLLSLVRLVNRGEEPLRVEYTELWDVPDGDYRASEGACERATGVGLRVLADAGVVLRTRAPDEPPARGLALDLVLVLPPRSLRQLYFAYAAPESDDPAGPLIRAWRGDVARELADVVRDWTDRVGGGPEAVSAFRDALTRTRA